MPLSYAICPDCIDGMDPITEQPCPNCDGSGRIIIEVDEEGEPVP